LSFFSPSFFDFRCSRRKSSYLFLARNFGDITIRSKLGASQNSLEAHSDYVGIAIENVATAKSRILDTDIANESSNLIKFQILTQSASAMLGQANLSPQVTLGLLGLLPSST
jgi:hypothetical protein